MLGDIKHNIPSSTIEERKDVENLLEKVQRYGIIHILPGNHDGNIRKIAPEDVIIHPSNGIVFDDIGFVHGHRWPDSKIMQCKQIIIGHTHPTIMLTDRLGYKKFEPCWLKVNLIEDKLKERYPNSADPQVLVIPAFNPLCGGIAANKEGITGPIGKIMNTENAQVYLLDGSCLGKVKNIK
jgi:putative SbcD/Mre11-related phosphoesterase